ncbi:EamA family transporter [Compostibacillus humi]|uniref:EamA family transporter n=1 Tax=Compostibacillus humi TaxID=1245525 RepID=A0A8J3EIM1_9BACI|nr:EamA family transporter [Compostibacillus humi]GGH72072.1 EamA family transporter [Compostibacillus humi]
MNRAFLCIIAGAALWGTIGWYVRNLYEFGMTPMEVVTFRAWISAFILTAFLFIRSRKSLRIYRWKDLRLFIGTGIFSIIFFNFCLFKSIEISTIPVATALLYTAPAFVTIFSYFLFQEPVTKNKLFALTITFIGTCLVVGLFPGDLDSLPWISIFIGLGSGLGYALYSIFSKIALRTYSSMQITTFTFIIAAISLTPFFPFKEKAYLFWQPEVLLFSFGLGLLPTALAYIIYTYGLEKTEASKASILSTIEPVVATVIGVFVFQESFTFIQLIGMVFIISAVFLIQNQENRKKRLPKSA